MSMYLVSHLHNCHAKESVIVVGAHHCRGSSLVRLYTPLNYLIRPTCGILYMYVIDAKV